ncbi:hypothetical protein [Propionivibrio sp.]|uniref:hypothetical protein n=1 Tax=Propionivibrio sp. TaxID=2212460 RepID=UPI00262FD5FC|nr:hypothetical protein [Propionivibrio sp.]
MTAPNTTQYLRLKSDTAPKLGLRASGGIHYSILCDADRQNLFVMVTGNDGGGYFSKEITPMSNILACLPTDGTAFSGKTLAKACVSRTANQPGFLMAITRHEGLTAAASDKPHQHVRTGDVEAWSAALLALPGEPYVPVFIGEASAPVTQAAVDPDPAPSEQSAAVTKRTKRVSKRAAATGDASA